MRSSRGASSLASRLTTVSLDILYLYYIRIYAYVCNTLRGQIKGFLQGNISYIALFRGQYLDVALELGQYLDIAQEGGF